MTKGLSLGRIRCKRAQIPRATQRIALFLLCSINGTADMMSKQNAFDRSREWRANARFSEGLKTLSEARTAPSTEKTRKALALFREAASLDASFGRARFYVGIASELYGQHRDAIVAFESLLQDER